MTTFGWLKGITLYNDSSVTNNVLRNLVTQMTWIIGTVVEMLQMLVLLWWCMYMSAKHDIMCVWFMFKKKAGVLQWHDVV